MAGWAVRGNLREETVSGTDPGFFRRILRKTPAERPFPCRSRFPLNGIYRSPPLPALPAPPPAPSRGGGQCGAIGPDTVPRSRNGISVRSFTPTAKRGSPPVAVCLWRIAPVGEGLTRRGWSIPLPLSLASHRDSVFPQATPTSGHAFAPPRNTCFFRQIHHNRDRSYLQ